MTANQLSYWNLQETKRANMADESRKLQEHAETQRSNLAKEKETNRSNLAKERETARSNVAKEVETARSNRASEALKAQSNAITKEHNDATELLSAVDTGIDAGTGILKIVSGLLS